jgi:hypothetical protein
VNYRDRDLLDLCHQFPCQLQLPCCEHGNAGEPAHSNQSKHGKGGMIKAHDWAAVPGCRSCHREIDQGRTMNRQEKFEAWDAAFWRYMTLLWNSGKIGVIA